MLRFVALNQEVNDEEIEEEAAVTQEAQESIAESEYIRAMKLMAKGYVDVALSLLTELLETQVLNEITSNKNDKLLAIRYNCHKNIAFIFEGKNEFETAIKHYNLAMEIDDTDIFTLNRFGQLALKINHFNLAEQIFEKCLQRNPHHFKAADGYLKALCQSGNILGAYGYALKIYRRDPKNKRAIATIRDVNIGFKHLIPFYNKFWQDASLNENELAAISKCSDYEDSVFPMGNTSEDVNQGILVPPDLRKFCLESTDWLSIGNYIRTVYKHLQDIGHNMLYTFQLEDIFKSESSTPSEEGKDCVIESNESLQEVVTNTFSGNSNESESNAKCDIDTNLSPGSDVNAVGTEPNNDDSDSNAKSDDTTKSKARRRCSDLLYLEQWGWHKNRRSNTRKKPQQEKPEIDTSLNGCLWRMFGKFKDKTFENVWPFCTDDGVKNDDSAKEENGTASDGEDPCSACKLAPAAETFQEATSTEFEAFLEELKGKGIDLMYLIYKWLKYVSMFWKKRLPDELKALYRDIFNLYIKHFDFSTWNQLPATSYINSYRICLFYIELQYINEENGSDSHTTWTNTFQHLMYNSGTAYVILNDSFYEFKLRLLHLKYLWFNHQHRLEKSVACLKIMEEVCANQPDLYVLHIPNVGRECIKRNFVTDMRIKLERQISLEKVPKLYENNNWAELVKIILNSISHSTDKHECEIWLKNFKTQVELLLQSLFNLNKFEECLIWSEKSLHYFVDRYQREKKFSPTQRMMGSTINFIYSHIESIILSDGFDILSILEDKLARLVQNIISILCYQLDGPYNKNSNILPDFDIKRPWIILHQILLMEENKTTKIVNEESDDEDAHIPNSFLILFTSHEFLGRRQWCTKDGGEFLHYILDTVSLNLRAPIYDVCRKSVIEYMEQVTYCLYGYPQRKGRSRHLEDHDATQDTVTLPKAIQIYDLFRPDPIPDINSYKFESISSDMEQLILKIVGFFPILDSTVTAEKIVEYINGKSKTLPDESLTVELPYKINCVFYLLADYYFKNRDFLKAIHYYMLDLACNPSRFDSWAGMALSKGNKIETKLNDLVPLTLESIVSELENVIRCFEQCITINEKQTLIWIEYGSFTYTIHSFCSRYLKYNSETLSMEQFSFAEERKERMLNIAFNCFSYAAQLQNTEDQGAHDEKWLSQYMLGKIAEKRQLEPKVYLNHYLTAANHLYENNATYPIKINHNNPTTLSIEALEIFYRINSGIIKYVENKPKITHHIGKLFKRVLNYLSDSPFAYNKAKIDGNTLNALKRKMTDKPEQIGLETKTMKMQTSENDNTMEIATTSVEDTVPNNVKPVESVTNEAPKEPQESSAAINETAPIDPNTTRRESQESVTGTATTTTTSSAVSSSDSSSSDDDSDSDSSNNDKRNDKECSPKQLDEIYRKVIQNLEECITRFPEHFKSRYRLVYHYIHGPPNLCDLNRCEQLLLGQYKTTLGNQISGLFYDRKNNNIFNGIWRIPSSEIDRPGSFAAHLVKCVSILIQLLMKKNNHRLLIDIGLQLYKTPDNDKRYIKDSERTELYQQSITFCSQVIRNIFKSNMEQRNDVELLDLLIEIYKIHKKCVKYMNQKEPLFTQLLIEVYRFYIQDKVVDNIPDSLNYLDLAIKLCLQEIAIQKNIEKATSNAAASAAASTTQPSNVGETVGGTFNNIVQSPLNVNRTVQIPGLRLWLKSNQYNPQNVTPRAPTYPTYVPRFDTHNPYTTQATSSSLATTFYSNLIEQSKLFLPLLTAGNVTPEKAKELQIYAECYKQLLERGPMGFNAILSLAATPTTTTYPPFSYASSLPQETTITPAQGRVTSQSVTVTPQAVESQTITISSISNTKAPEPLDKPLTTVQPTVTAEDVRQSIFVKSLTSLQASPTPSNLSNVQSPCGSSGSASDKTNNRKQPRYESKAKSSAKNKQNASKPYNRASQSNTNLPEIPDLSNFPIDTSIVNSITGEQVYTFPHGASAANQRKVNDSVYPFETKPNNLSTYPQSTHLTPFNFSSIDPNAVTITTLPSTKRANVTTNQFPSLGGIQKTLQQKLAERQKVNLQLNEAKPTTIAHDEIIEIPD